MANKTANIWIKTHGVQGMLKNFSVINKQGKLSFQGITNEAKKTALAVTAALGAAVAAFKPAFEALKKWEQGWQQANRMLGLSRAEVGAYQAQLQQLATGPLAGVEGLLDGATDALYGYISAMGQTRDHSAVFSDLETAARAAAVSNTDLNNIMGQGSRIASVANMQHGELSSVFDLLAVTEQKAIANLSELTDGIAKLSVTCKLLVKMYM